MVKKTLKTVITGAGAGLVNGFLGTGGGIIILLSENRSDGSENNNTRDIYASTALVTMIFSVISAVVYAIRGNFPASEAFTYAVPALTGGIVGALLLDKLPKKVLNIIFSVLVIVAGIIMIFK